ncbi:MAG: hypothetical protein K2H53_02870 [Clostridia bacterium]|nr:hypothetical protein [Clostridia bacterium]
MATVKTYTALVNELNNRVTLSVQNVAKIVCDKLWECIDKQYYNDPGFYPNIYKRTETFLNSVTYEMLGKNSARVGIDIAGMHYKNGFSARQVVDWAKESMHGAPMYQTATEDFWSVFIEWADENIPELLKSELKKNGLNVK